MSNLTGQAPLGLKKQKAKKDEAYLQELRGRGCVVCLRFGEAQRSATTAHHTSQWRSDLIEMRYRFARAITKAISTLQK